MIGTGNMGSALLAGITKNTAADRIWIYDIKKTRAAGLAKKLKVRCAKDPLDALSSVDIVILAVKPNNIQTVLEALASGLKDRHVLVSIAAGISIKKISGLTGKKKKIVRVMPNTPALIGSGISALTFSASVSQTARKRIAGLFACVGETATVPEKWMDAVTGVSGSGPAYVYMFLDALTKAGVREGLPAATARKLAVQTVIGAAKLSDVTNADFAKLRADVSSPNGTTVAGCGVLDKKKFTGIVMDAVKAAAKRSREIRNENESAA